MANMSTGLLRGITTVDCFNALLANGTIGVYGGSLPSSADAAPVGTLLGWITKDGNAFTPGSATNGVNMDTDITNEDGFYWIKKASAETWKFTAVAAGTAVWFRHFANPVDSGAISTTLYRVDGTIGSDGSGAEMILPTLTITIGMPKMTVDTFRYRRK